MALPIVEWSVETGGSGLSRQYQYRRGWKQTKPIDKTMVLSYEARRASASFLTGGSTTQTAAWQSGIWANPDTVMSNFTRLAGDCVNQSYAKLIDKIRGGTEAGLGESLAEFGQSARMVAYRGGQMLSFVRALRKGRFGDAWASLQTDLKPPKRWSKSRSFASNFLEAHFGWEPLIKDIHSAVKVLTTPLPAPFGVRAQSSTIFMGDLATPVNIFNPAAWYPSNYYQKSYTKVQGSFRVVQGAQITVTNPNVALAAQLGLINPLSVAFAVIPYSFVADWVANISQVIDSMTDLLGLSVANGYTTYVSEYTYEKYHEARYKWLENGNTVYGGGVFENSRGVGKGMRRGVGLTLPSLQLRPYKVPSLTRAATAIALLAQQLPKK